MVGVSCLKHRSEYGSTLVHINSRWLGTDCPQCETEETRREQHIFSQNHRQSVAMHGLREAGIPRRFIGKNFDSFTVVNQQAGKNLEICTRYASNFGRVYSNGICLVLCGSPGTGKTHLACAIGNQLVESGKTVLFTGCIQAISKVKETWRAGSQDTEREVIERYVALDLLILDEVGVQFGSEAEKIILFQIINRRYEEVKPTIIIANLTKDELAGYLGERVVDRLGENGGPVLAFDWASYR